MLLKTQINKIIPKLPSIKLASLKQLHENNKNRIDKHINKYTGTGHVKEYKLMQEFEKQNIVPYIIGVEYEIHDGVLLDHSGDVMGYDGENTIFVIELKCIKFHHNQQERRLKVRDQANKLHKRLTSWINHMTTIDMRMERLKDFDIKKGFYTDEQKDNIILL